MRLSEAIILGDSLKLPTNIWWLDGEDGNYCGCAIGGALLAVGITLKEFLDDPQFEVYEMQFVKSRWPWLKAGHLDEITWLYQRVISGTGTIEDVAAFVRSIEPEEPQQESNETTKEETVCV